MITKTRHIDFNMDPSRIPGGLSDDDTSLLASTVNVVSLLSLMGKEQRISGPQYDHAWKNLKTIHLRFILELADIDQACSACLLRHAAQDAIGAVCAGHMQSLTSVKHDLLGCALRVLRSHPCAQLPGILMNLEKLKVLQIRVLSVCHDFFDALDSPHDVRCPLETLMINASLVNSDGSRCEFCGPVAWSCAGERARSIQALSERLDGLKQAATSFSRPQSTLEMVRILWPQLQKRSTNDYDIVSDGVIAWDCNTNQRKRLNLSNEWTSDGQPFPGRAVQTGVWDTKLVFQ